MPDGRWSQLPGGSIYDEQIPIRNTHMSRIYETKPEWPSFALVPLSEMPTPTDTDGNDNEVAPPNSAIPEIFLRNQIYLPASLASTSALSSHSHDVSLSARGAAFDTTFSPNTFLSNSNPLSFAIPLGFMLSIMLVAVVLVVHHYRRCVRKRSTDAEKLSTLGRLSSRDSTCKNALEYPASATLPAHVSGPVPLFMSVDMDTPPAQETRRAARKSVPVSVSYTNVSAPAREPTKVMRGPRALTVSRGSAETSEDAGGEKEKGPWK